MSNTSHYDGIFIGEHLGGCRVLSRHDTEALVRAIADLADTLMPDSVAQQPCSGASNGHRSHFSGS